MKIKPFIGTSIFIVTLFFASISTVQAQFTLLPYTNQSLEDCNKTINTYQATGVIPENFKDPLADPAKPQTGDRDNLLGCGIKTGKISLQMIPYYITYIINFALALVGLICVLFIMVGGYYYTFSGLTDDKDKGKKTIKHALMGLGLAILAWTLVNVIIKAITG